VIDHEFTPWLVTVVVEKVVSGEFSGSTFSFAVHSPAMSGLEVGRFYTVRAEWNGSGYVVDPLQWRRAQLSGAHIAASKADHPPALAIRRSTPKVARTTVIPPDSPSVVVFAPAQWELDAKSDEGTREEIAHVRFAVGDVNRCKGAARIRVRMVFSERLVLPRDHGRTEIDLSSRFPDSAGAYLFRPGKKPCVLATPNDTAFLGEKLSQAVGEFFEVPECLQEGWLFNSVCTAGSR
jgi:hypothetical protein